MGAHVDSSGKVASAATGRVGSRGARFGACGTTVGPSSGARVETSGARVGFHTRGGASERPNGAGKVR